MNNSNIEFVAVPRCIRQMQYSHAKVSMFANKTDVTIIAMGGNVAHSLSHRKD